MLNVWESRTPPGFILPQLCWGFFFVYVHQVLLGDGQSCPASPEAGAHDTMPARSWMSHRKKLACFTALMLVVLPCCALIFAVPVWIRYRISVIARSHGMSASVGSVTLSPSGIRLKALTLTRADALTLRLDTLRIDRFWETWFLDAQAGALSLIVQDVQIEANVDGLRELLALHERGESSGRRSARSNTILAARIAVSNVRVRVVDRHGLLADGEVQQLTSQARVLTFSAKHLRLYRRNDARTPSLVVGHARCRVQKAARLWRLGDCEIRRPRLVLADFRPQSRGLARFARHLRALQVSHLAKISTVGQTSQYRSVFERLANRFSAGSRFEIRQATLFSVSGGDALVRNLGWTLTKHEDGSFQVTGAGEPQRGGGLRWNFRVRPDEARARGEIRFAELPFEVVSSLTPSVPWHRPEHATLSGGISVANEGAGRIRFDLNAALDGVALKSQAISDGPVEFGTQLLNAAGHWSPLSQTLELEHVSWSLGALRVLMQGRVRGGLAPTQANLQLTLERARCDDLVEAIPAELVGPLYGLRFEGELAAQMRVAIDMAELEATRLQIRFADACQFHTIPAVADVERFRHPFVHVVYEPDGTRFELATGPGSEAWTPLREISPYLIHAVLLHEDGGFLHHHGFSVAAIRRAIVRNLESGRFAAGGSTITMQLAKNLFLSREKTLARKVQEALLTWWLETALEKREILELYLNVIEYGAGTYGIRAAAERFFGLQPAELGPAEAAYVAALLPQPSVSEEHLRRGSIPPRWQRRVARFLGALHSHERIDAWALAEGLRRLPQIEFRNGDAPRDPVTPDYRGARPLPNLFQE